MKKLVLAITLEKGEEGRRIEAAFVHDDLIAHIKRSSVWIDDTEYQVTEVNRVAEGFPLAAVDVQYLARLLRGERGAANAKHRKRIDKILSVLGESLPPEAEVEVTDL